MKEKMNTPSNPPPSVHVVVQESQIVGGVKTEDDETDTKVDINGNYTFTRQDKLRQAFDISSFNHMSREVSDVEKSVYFYTNILGFQPIPRPKFEVDGEWLWGHGLNFHVVKTSNPEARQTLRKRRIKYFHENLPSVDHVAFLAKDLDMVRSLLQEEDIYFREFRHEQSGIRQLFFFDPDGNAIEVSNCAPPIGATQCRNRSNVGELEDLCYLEANGYF